jgi:hypothetical protein
VTRSSCGAVCPATRGCLRPGRLDSQALIDHTPRMRCARWVWVVGAVFVLGCSSDDGQRREIVNTGALCPLSDSTETLSLTVVFPGCLSTSCDRVVSAECNISVSGTRIEITSRGVSESSGAELCTSDCRTMKTTCQSDGPLSPGEYSVVHGDDEGSLSLPVATRQALFAESGNSSFNCAL